MTIRGTTSVCRRFRWPQRGADTPPRGNGRTPTDPTDRKSCVWICSLRLAAYSVLVPINAIEHDYSGVFHICQAKEKIDAAFLKKFFFGPPQNGFSAWQRALSALSRKSFSIHCSAPRTRVFASSLVRSPPRPRHKAAPRTRVFASSSRAFSRERGVIGSPFMMRASSATLPCSSSGLISVKVLPPEISFSISR